MEKDNKENVKDVKQDRKNDIQYIRWQKDRYWRNFVRVKSLLLSELAKLSTKSENDITKKDLVYIISLNCDYMRALNMYNYYRDCLTFLKVSNNGK